MTILKAKERVDDLQLHGYKIIQRTDGFCFGIDAVLLANFVTYRKGQSCLVDLGTGTGIVPILLAAKSDIAHIYGVEIQEEIADMARRSVAMNDLTQRVSIIADNLTQAERYLGRASADIVTCNPPYMPTGKLTSENPMLYISRNEVYCTISDVMRASSYLLKPKGKLYMVHRPSRLCDIFVEARRYQLEPKLLQMVHPKVEKPANMVLLSFLKHGKPELKMLPPLYVHREDGSYYESIREIYSRESLRGTGPEGVYDY